MLILLVTKYNSNCNPIDLIGLLFTQIDDMIHGFMLVEILHTYSLTFFLNFSWEYSPKNIPLQNMVLPKIKDLLIKQGALSL